MARTITVGAAQLGPISSTETRSDVVARLIGHLRNAHAQKCDLVVFPECALTPFFPHWYIDDQQEVDAYFEREMPGAETRTLFDQAKRLGIGFSLGYAELDERSDPPRHFNTSILVGPDGQIIGKYRKIHLPGYAQPRPDHPFQNLEKRYFDVGDLGFRTWKAFGGVVGMMICNDRRWPESYRVLGLNGVELTLMGYNTPEHNPDYPELDRLVEFHHLLSIQAGAYQNGTWVVAVAKAGWEEGVEQIGQTAIVAPSGEVAARTVTVEDELIVHRCNLDLCRPYKESIFNFAAHRRVEHYGPITGQVGARPPESSNQEKLDAVERLFVEDYGYSTEAAASIAERTGRVFEIQQPEQPADKPTRPKIKFSPEPKPAAAAVSKPADSPIAEEFDDVVRVFTKQYGYSREQAEFIVRRAEAVLEAQATEPQEKDDAAPAKPTPDKPAPDKPSSSRAASILERARAADSKPSAERAPKKLSPLELARQADGKEKTPRAAGAPSASKPKKTQQTSDPAPILEESGEVSEPAASDGSGLAERTRAVKELLVTQYGYPDNSATAVADRAQVALEQSDDPYVPAEGLLIFCPNCKQRLKLPDQSLLGRKARCPECQEKFILTAPGSG